MAILVLSDFGLFVFLIVVYFGKLDIFFELSNISFGGVVVFVFEWEVIFAIAVKYFGIGESKLFGFVLL